MPAPVRPRNAAVGWRLWSPTRWPDRALHIDVLAVSEALDRLAGRHARQARVVELRFFGGLTSEEISQVLSADGEEVSARTVDRDWTFARAWLERQLGTGR